MRILIVLSAIILCGCASSLTGLRRGMYHEHFRQTYADKLDGWMERRFGSRYLIGDYYFKNGPRVVIVWWENGGYVSIDDYKIYFSDFDNYDWLDGYTKPPDCDAW